MLEMARTHAITTPKSCQDRKVAAIRDACDRRGIRAFWLLKVASKDQGGSKDQVRKAGLSDFLGRLFTLGVSDSFCLF